MSTELVRPGDVWRDLDPRGGPTFRIRSVHPLMFPPYAMVEDLNGKRIRRVLLQRFRRHANYRSGYMLISRAKDAKP